MRIASALTDSKEALTFFHVHRNAEHFDQTSMKLTQIWKKHPLKVQKAFDFIQQHQSKMWKELSNKVLLENSE